MVTIDNSAVAPGSTVAQIQAYIPPSTSGVIVQNTNVLESLKEEQEDEGNSNATQTKISGTTAGSATCSMPEQGSSYKKVIVYLDGYENDSTTAQTYTFPVAFSNTPAVSTNSASVPGVTVSTTKLSLAPDTTTAYTGWIIIEGY